jgi:hypothetical protein
MAAGGAVVGVVTIQRAARDQHQTRRSRHLGLATRKARRAGRLAVHQHKNLGPGQFSAEITAEREMIAIDNAPGDAEPLGTGRCLPLLRNVCCDGRHRHAGNRKELVMGHHRTGHAKALLFIGNVDVGKVVSCRRG